LTPNFRANGLEGRIVRVERERFETGERFD
jgi:hypothetical protein